MDPWFYSQGRMERCPVFHMRVFGLLYTYCTTFDRLEKGLVIPVLQDLWEKLKGAQSRIISMKFRTEVLPSSSVHSVIII